MADAADIIDSSDAARMRDAELFRVISKHGIHPVVFAITKEEAAELAQPFAQMFSFAPAASAETDAKHAPLFRAIRQSSK
jgi:hypothetical protein